MAVSARHRAGFRITTSLSGNAIGVKTVFYSSTSSVGDYWSTDCTCEITPSVRFPRRAICGPFDQPIHRHKECLNLAPCFTPVLMYGNTHPGNQREAAMPVMVIPDGNLQAGFRYQQLCIIGKNLIKVRSDDGEYEMKMWPLIGIASSNGQSAKHENSNSKTGSNLHRRLISFRPGTTCSQSTRARRFDDLMKAGFSSYLICFNTCWTPLLLCVLCHNDLGPSSRLTSNTVVKSLVRTSEFAGRVKYQS